MKLFKISKTNDDVANFYHLPLETQNKIIEQAAKGSNARQAQLMKRYRTHTS